MGLSTASPGSRSRRVVIKGYWESYKSEIAAYELDKLLNLDMFPPAVERKLEGDLGAAVMWVSPAKSFKQLGGAPHPPPAQLERWNRQIIRAKMIDNLIANTDPNLGNWLVDPAWNIVLIDHSRAFTSTRKMTHEMTRIDDDLWGRMQALDQNGLAAALGSWLSTEEIDALLRRRDAMKALIDALVAKRGEAAVFGEADEAPALRRRSLRGMRAVARNQCTVRIVLDAPALRPG